MPDFSHIQKLILSKLLTSDGLRYSELRPEDIDKDLYYYHLKFLIEKGFIEKTDKIYHLTNQGKSTVTNLSYQGDFNNQFKIGLFFFIEKDKQILMHTRKRQPYYDDYLPPSGTFKQGELLAEAIKRKLSEETGLQAEFKRIGMIRLIFYKEAKLVEDISMHLLYSNKYSGEFQKENDYGIFEFSDYENAIVSQQKNKTKITTMTSVLEQLKRGDFAPIYLEEKILLEDI
ncbi:MAG: NUDIX domain-containing protein [bacterium]